MKKLLFLLLLTLFCNTARVVAEGTVTDDSYTWPMTFVTTGQTAAISGKIDATKYPAVDTLEIRMEYSTTPFTTTDGPSDKLIAKAHQSLNGGVEGINSDGTYYWNLSTLTPATKYYFRQIILVKATQAVLNSRAGEFNSTKGYVGEGSVAAQTAFDQKSYHLLAPWPGLAVLMDPDLCAQQKAEQKIGPNAVCDINGFINFAFKTLIGITAVVLVLRLMYEGYQYIVTDIPFLKASAKSGFLTALTGLLLALSAFIILNTINPKLVENSINIASVSVGVENFTFSGTAEAYTTTNGVKTKVNTLKLKDLLPYAQKASQASGVDVSTILGILWVETKFNASDGGCAWDKPGVMPTGNPRNDRAVYIEIVTSLGISANDHKVSCNLSSNTWGGAMGPSQHIPTSWKGYTSKIKQASGKTTADPWDLQDALYALAIHMKDDGGATDPQNAACKYYSGHACGTKPQDSQKYGNLEYRDRFNGAVAAIKAEIAKIQ